MRDVNLRLCLHLQRFAGRESACAYTYSVLCDADIGLCTQLRFQLGWREQLCLQYGIWDDVDLCLDDVIIFMRLQLRYFR